MRSDIDDPNKLISYEEGLGACLPESGDKINFRKVMKLQFDLIKEQKQEIADQRKYREESRKYAKHSFKYVIAGIAIASLTLIVAIIGLVR